VDASSNIATKYVKQNLVELKEEIDKPIILVGDFKTPLSSTGRTTKGKKSARMYHQHRQLKGLISMYGTIYPIIKEYIFCSDTHRIYIYQHRLSSEPKKTFNTLKRIERYKCVLKLEKNNRRI
jgi:hypothetical protein